MNRFRITLLILILASSSVSAQRIYRFYNPGDWVTYASTRYVNCIAKGFNSVYFGTRGGIIRYDIANERWLDPMTISDGLPANNIRQLAVDRLTDEIWVETSRGGSYYNPTWEEWRDNLSFPLDKVQTAGVRLSDIPSLFPSDGYSYMLGGTLMSRDLLEYPITQMLRDDNDVIWMGIWGLGAAKGDLRRSDLKLLPFGPYDDDIAYLDRDGEDFWMLGGSSGLPGNITHYDRSVGQWTYFEPERQSGVVSDRFSALTHDDKNIWIGTDMGLIRMDKRSGTFRSYTQFEGIEGEIVYALLPIKNNLLIGTDRGVSVLDLTRDSIYGANSAGMKGRPIYAFAIRDRAIYAGTPTGIVTLDWGGSQWRSFMPTTSLLKGAIYDLQVVDSLLYAVGDDGVAVINLNSLSEKIYDRNTKFRNAELTTLLVHKGIVWVGGSSGLYRLNNKSGNWYRYTTSDGLPSLRVSGMVGDGDYIWIGTDQGVTRFYWKVFNRSDWLD